MREDDNKNQLQMIVYVTLDNKIETEIKTWKKY
jgi:hypothetical protein